MKKSNALLLSMLILFVSIIFLLFSTLQKYSQLTFMHVYNFCHQAVTSWFTTGIHFLGFGVSAAIVLISIVFLLKTFMSFLKTRKMLTNISQVNSIKATYKLTQIGKKINLSDHHLVVFNSQQAEVFTGGLFSLKIYISQKLINSLSAKELEAVIIHEKYHLDRKHSLWLFIADIIFSTFIFIPVFKSLFYLLKVQFEKEADAKVLHAQKTDIYLQKALTAVIGEPQYAYYPRFYSRRTYRFSVHHFLISILSMSALLTLLFIPLEAHASAIVENRQCGENQCSVDCTPEVQSDASLQSKISSQNSLYSPHKK